MAEKNYSVAQDLKEAQAMVDGLEGYVQQDNLYGTVGGGGFFSGGRMPALTIGSLAMRIRRLNVMVDRGELTDEQRQQLKDIETKHEAVANEWRMHYEKMLRREVNSRLDAMKTFFEECASNPKLCARVYQPEVLRRTIAEEGLIRLDAMNVDHEDESKKARGMDGRLRRFVQPSEFVWDEALTPVYDKKQFWWMYNHPPTEN